MIGTEIISVRGLRKAYGATPVLAGVDLGVQEGTVTALLGPNGAGKTTLVHILATLVRADGGSASVAGADVSRDPAAVRSAIGLTGQFAAVDALLTGEENLMLMARLRHLGRRPSRARVSDLIERFDLTDAARKPLATYSGGMRRRLDLAMTLVTSPRVIFLDEPTTGLDPASRRTMWDMVRELVSDGTTILLTTQYLEEADQLADRVAVLDGGRIIAEGAPEELKRRIPGGHLRLRFADERGVDAAVRLLAATDRDPATHSASVAAAGVEGIRRVLAVLDAEEVRVEDVATRTPDLDDVFFALTGHAVREGSGS